MEKAEKVENHGLEQLLIDGKLNYLGIRPFNQYPIFSFENMGVFAALKKRLNSTLFFSEWQKHPSFQN